MTKKQPSRRAKTCEKGFGISRCIFAVIEQMGARGMITKRCLKLPSEKRDTQIT